MIEIPGAREYNEKEPVSLGLLDGRVVIWAANEGGYNSTCVDLLDVLEFLEGKTPEQIVTMIEGVKGDDKS